MSKHFVLMIFLLMLPNQLFAAGMLETDSLGPVRLSNNTYQNSASWTQLNTNSKYFLGRRKLNADGTGRWTLILGEMRETTESGKTIRTIHAIKQLTGLNSKIAGNELRAAYDPFPMHDGREYWVAFECAVANVGARSVSACMAPLNMTSKSLDFTRSYILIGGKSANVNSVYHSSASVPKLLYDNGKAYAYWTAVKVNKTNSAIWHGLTTRGIELSYNAQQRRWLPAGYNRIDIPSDHNLTSEVFGTENQGKMNKVADGFQVIKKGSYYYLFGAVGDCYKPLDNSPGCYRLAMRRSNSPMGHRIFNNGQRVPENLLPSNSHEYFRHYIYNNKRKFMGKLLPSKVSFNVESTQGHTSFDFVRDSVFLQTGSLSYRDDPVWDIVNGAYRKVLGRDVDNGGLNTWSDRLYAGMQQSDFLTGLVNSSEGRRRFQFDLEARSFVIRAYRLLFGRSPSSTAADNWALMIVNDRLNRTELISHLMHSTEFKNNNSKFAPLYSNPPAVRPLHPAYRAVNSGYTMVLHRIPDENGAQSNFDRLVSNRLTSAQFLENLFFSGESVRKNEINNLSNGQYLELLFDMFLNRAPDSGVRNAWNNMVRQRSDARRVMFRSVVNSQEFANKHPEF